MISAIVAAFICLYFVTPMLTSKTEHGSRQASTAVRSATSDAPDSTGAASDQQPYSVSMIDANKNSIATGTKLSAEGTMYSTRWGPTDTCTWLLIRGKVNIQHGEANPADYCRFSIILTEKNEAGEDMWPGAGLLCDVSPEELKSDTHQYHYGDRVRVYGSYAASLDFAVAYVPGSHFGVPVLENCTIDGLAAGKSE
jgi:hypothetical protein